MSYARFFLGLFFLFFCSSVACSEEIKFSWQPNSEPEVISYRLYYGTSSHNYTDYIEIDNNPVDSRVYGTVSGLVTGQTYYFAVTACTATGLESDYSKELHYLVGETSIGFPSLEAGQLEVRQNWIHVAFSSAFTHPVVIAKIISQNDPDPCVVRIRNVNSDGFDVKIQEWNYLDGVHGNEVVSYLVMEKGTYELADGTHIEADTFATSGTTSFEHHNFKQSYNSLPVLTTSITTFNGGDTVTGRHRNISSAGFDYLLQEQEANNDGHVNETVAYIVWDRSDGTINGLTYSVGTTGETVAGSFKRADFRAQSRAAFPEVPVVVAGMLTANGMDTAVARSRSVTTTGMDVKIEEEQSADDEIGHTSENIGYMAISNSIKLPLEAGEVEVRQNWVHVAFSSAFTHPVVIAKIISQNDPDPCVVRIRNVNSDGFDVKIQEWNYLDGVHGNEVVSYLVMEKGTYELADGTHIEADTFATSETTSFEHHNFKQSYNSLPVLMTSITTFNGGDTVTGRHRNISSAGFDYLLQEQEANNDGHVNETVAYIVWDRSDGTINGLTYSVGTTGETVGGSFKRAGFRAQNRPAFPEVPVVVADMLTANGMDTAVERSRSVTTTGMDVKIEEEQSADDEMGHTSENIGYIAVSH